MGNFDGGGGHIIVVLATRGPQIHLEHTHTFHVLYVIINKYTKSEPFIDILKSFREHPLISSLNKYQFTEMLFNFHKWHVCIEQVI